MSRRHRPAGDRRALKALAAWAALLAGCGSVGDPQPPLANLPRPVSDLAVRQVADEIRIAWSWPVTTTEGMIARRIGGFTVWAVDVPDFGSELRPETIDEYGRAVHALSRDELGPSEPGDRLEVRLPLDRWTLGQPAVIVVTARNPAGRHAGYSNQVRLQPLAPPGRAEWKPAAVTREGVELAWTAADLAEEYAVERATGEEGAFVRLGRLAAGSFLDRTVRWKETYRYRLRPLRLSQAGWIEGPLLAEIAVTPLDTFPPAVPEELRAVRATGSVELSWLPSPDEDVQGYRVRRDGELLADLVRGTTYSDLSAPSGQRFEYTVTAIDVEGNESGPSATAVPSARAERSGSK